MELSALFSQCSLAGSPGHIFSRVGLLSLSSLLIISSHSFNREPTPLQVQFTVITGHSHFTAYFVEISDSALRLLRAAEIV
jgi:hypothetical protein